MKIKANASWNNAAIARVRARLQEKASKYDQKATIEIGVGGEDANVAAIKYDGSKGEATLGEVARWMEFGTKTIPERRWLRGWFDLRAEELRRGLVDAVRKHYVIAWAQSLSEQVREMIKAGSGDLHAPLAESTKAARARAGLRVGPALYATGQFVEAIKARVNGEVADGKSPGYSKLGGR